MISNPCRLLVTADDRTGALEIGGAVGNAEFLVPVGPYAESDICCTIDLNSRHLSASEAYKKTLEAHRRPADKRCHKMDSGMRGNWPHEVQALVDLGHLVAVVPSYPAAGAVETASFTSMMSQSLIRFLVRIHLQLR